MTRDMRYLLNDFGEELASKVKKCSHDMEENLKAFIVTTDRANRRNQSDKFFYTMQDDFIFGAEKGLRGLDSDFLRAGLSTAYKERFKDFLSSTGSEGMYTTLTLTETLPEYFTLGDEAAKNEIINTKFNALDVLDAAKCDMCRSHASAENVTNRHCHHCKRVLVVEGRAGIGKTTFARQMARLQKQKHGFCIFVSLAEVLEKMKEIRAATVSALELIGLSLQKKCAANLGVVPLELVESVWASEEPIVWLLDGYDEVAHDPDPHVEQFLEEF